jgi:hypothetical protein
VAAKLPPQPLGVAPGSSYWNDWYEKLRSFVDSVGTSIGNGLLVRQDSATMSNLTISGITTGGFPGETTTVPLAQLTPTGIPGSLVFSDGILIGHIDPT